MAAGRQGRRIAGVNIAEEICPIINQGAQIDFKMLDQSLGQLVLDGLDVLFFDAIHVVPESLAGELSPAGWEEAGADGLAVPMSPLSLAGGTGGAMDRRPEQILSDRETMVAFGKLSVHQSDQVQFHG